jgi:hypothetical protein
MLKWLRKNLVPPLVRGLLLGPQWLLPHAYELYAALVIPRSRLVKDFFRTLVETPAFQPHYVYLNLGHCLAIDPASGRVLAASRHGAAFQALGDIRTFAGRGRGFGYQLRLDFADGTSWEARTLVSIEPLLTAEDVLRLELARATRGEPLPPPQVDAFGAGVDPVSRTG